MSDSMNMLSMALAYTHQNGERHQLKVFPLVAGTKFPLYGSNGYKDASDNEEQLRKWWNNENQNANIGIPTGRINGIFVIDVDKGEGKDGAESLRLLEADYGTLPETWEVITGGGGSHLYFRYPEGHELGIGASSIPLLDGTKAKDIDFRGNGGYVVAPPSTHTSGNRYEWQLEHYPNEFPLADLPEAWITAIEKGIVAGNDSKFLLPDTIPEGGRNETLFKYGCSLRASRIRATDILKRLNEVNTTKCKPPLANKDIETIYNSILKYPEGIDGYRYERKPIPIPTGANGAENKMVLQPEDYSDSGNAERFAEYAKDRLLWCDSLDWLVWDGRRWEQNKTGAITVATAFAKDMLQDAYQTMVNSFDDKGQPSITAKEYHKHALKTRNKKNIQNFLELSKPALTIHANQLDADPFDLNCQAGIIDLKTGNIRKHDPKALCTKISPYTPNAGGTGEDMWYDFLGLITQGDESLQDYLQSIIGMSAIGKVFEQGLTIALGEGRNGKSTFFNAVSYVLGDYATGFNADCFIANRFNMGDSGVDAVTLRGARLAVCGELDQGQLLSTKTLKRLTSTEKYRIKEMYKSPCYIEPSHTLVMHTNFLPNVKNTDQGTWRRLHIIPFNAVMPTGNEVITNYSAHLADKAGGAILQWIVNGAVFFYNSGARLTHPPIVEALVSQFRGEQDMITAFLEECVSVTQSNRNRVLFSDMYNAYKAYLEPKEIEPEGLKTFNQALRGKGYRYSESGHKSQYWTFVKLNSITPEE